MDKCTYNSRSARLHFSLVDVFEKGFVHIPDFILLILCSDLCSANGIFQMQSDYLSLVYKSDKLHIDLETTMMPYSLL